MPLDVRRSLLVTDLFRSIDLGLRVVVPEQWNAGNYTSCLHCNNWVIPRSPLLDQLYFVYQPEGHHGDLCASLLFIFSCSTGCRVSIRKISGVSQYRGDLGEIVWF